MRCVDANAFVGIAATARMRIRALRVLVLALRKIAVGLGQCEKLRLIWIVLDGQAQRDLWNKLAWVR